MTDTLTAIGGALAVLAVLVVLLRGLAAWGRRLGRDPRPGPAPAEPVPAPLAEGGPGWLSTDEEDTQEWRIETTARDIARLTAIEDTEFRPSLDRLFERTLRLLQLSPRERDWARLYAGDTPEDGRR